MINAEMLSKIRRPQLGEEVPVLVFRAFRLYTERRKTAWERSWS
ncbi:hypothetical protein [Thermocrinis minervae]|uniref:Uncharacterized protein n=1 Tax=Thermocrinis minervae TaxID=381751 RepID=A0A1M6QNV5_9AQUI|nr:hypothetical protein [Thermocrinis minervae]SHK21941.1 hypothetical protein SAMN05444391_0320 [Thermocrinis minervae]